MICVPGSAQRGLNPHYPVSRQFADAVCASSCTTRSFGDGSPWTQTGEGQLQSSAKLTATCCVFILNVPRAACISNLGKGLTFLASSNVSVRRGVPLALTSPFCESPDVLMVL